MYFETRSFIVVVFILLVCLGPGVPPTQAQQIRIEGVFPRQLPRGQATLVNVAIPSRDAIQAADISPSAGVKVSSIKLGQNFQGALTWSELTIDVAQEALPGERTLVLLLPMGRTAPVTITIPTHVPKISELRVVSTQSNPPTLEVEFSAADTSADLGSSPYVWFMVRCRGEVLPGVLHGNFSARDKDNGVVRVSVPNTSTRAGGNPTTDACDLQVRLTDMSGIESNTLRTTVEPKKE
jgi:hypothetical protein